MADRTMRSDRTWSFNVLRTESDTDWPEDRPVRYSTVGRKYRPVRVNLVFHKRNVEPPKLSGSGIYGPRIISSGPNGAVVCESLYGTTINEPWFMEIVAACLEDVMRDLARGVESE